ncbi:MAG: cation:proton antiporter regulatory subunit [Sedimentisphaeraceae bacterium JB056]
MSLTLFVIVLTASFVIVRIGAIAFQLTGLEWSLAKFQALSCFSGTGFTTRESELVTGNPQRRKIATVLMVLGNAGIVTLIGTFANALNTERSMWKTVSDSILPFAIPDFLVPWINLITILIPAYLIYKLFTNRLFLRKLTNSLRKRIHRNFFTSVTIEELVVITGGYGVARIEVDNKSQVINKTLAESHLRENDITVLAISRGEETISNPPASTKILEGDELISFGNLENLRNYT